MTSIRNNKNLDLSHIFLLSSIPKANYFDEGGMNISYYFTSKEVDTEMFHDSFLTLSII